jgi:integrase
LFAESRGGRCHRGRTRTEARDSYPRLTPALGLETSRESTLARPSTLAYLRENVAPLELAGKDYARSDDADELDARGAAAVRFAAATGLRPSEWANLERRDIDRAARVVNVRGTKTHRSRREVPLTAEALAALDSLPIRLDSVYVFAAPRGGPLNLHNFANRDWAPAVEAAGVEKPATLYDLRDTFASNALAAGITVYELARIMGTSVAMIERHYGALVDTAKASILARLENFGARLGHDEKDEGGKTARMQASRT